MKIKHKFVQFIPDDIERNTLYISIEFGTAVHKCMCGCGNEVVTPLSPTDWELIYNGETVSLYPSIGNWGLKCESHYWITRDKVKFVEKWSMKRITKNRNADKINKKRFFDTKETSD
ncbi:MAG: hypothetical protein BroJett042_24640 [Bacteroidota bacterium]|nr:MAG: hypothetical protein BroJett042_24640 [Bacteroidota bacterium]HNS29678.1 DUF6527 family protein [Tenuifilaceae bacterium]